MGVTASLFGGVPVAQEIGSAYISVLPSTKNFGKSIEGEVDSGLGGATKKADKGFGALVKKTAKWGVAAVAAAGAAITGLAVSGGISRALNIEDAQAKLKGLGHDAKSVDQIMVDALGSVRGTAYGLDAAATTAASAVAAGIKPGKELESYLRLTADAATIAGTSMGEMGSIINKVTANGRAMTENLNQLQDRGIPIMQWLADEYGVTAEELSKMVSRGEVDAATFRRVIEENIGGAALASGDTTRGAFANMGAALSRLGLTVVQPFVDNAKGLFNEINVIIDGLNDRIKPFADAFSEAFGGKMADSLDGFGERFLAVFDKVTEGIGKLMSGDADFSSMFDSVLEAAQNGIGKAADWVAAGGAEKLISGMLSSRSAIFDGAMQVFPAIAEALVAVVPLVTQTLVGLIGSITQMLPQLVGAAVTLFTGLVEGLVIVVPQLLAAVVAAIPQIVEALVGLIPVVVDGAIQLFTGLIDALVIVVPMLIVALVEAIPQVVEALVGMIPAVLDGAIQLFMALVEAIPVILPLLLQSIVDLLPMLLSTIIGLIPKLLQGAIQLFMALVDAIPRILPLLLAQILSMLPQILQSILGMIPQLLLAAIDLFWALIDAIPKILPTLIGALVDVGPKIFQTIKAMIPQMVQAGKDLLMGLAKGIGDAVGAVVGKAKEVAGKIVSSVKGFFGIHSPSRVFRDEIGEMLVAGLAEGLGDDDAALESSRKLSQGVLDAFGSPSLDASFHGGSAFFGGGGDSPAWFSDLVSSIFSATYEGTRLGAGDGMSRRSRDLHTAVRAGAGVA